jgi:hypothetical protein
MERNEVLNWLEHHTQQVHDVPELLLSRCETEVKEHAQEDAWLHARDIAEEHNQFWRSSWGAHASEEFVAREVCKDLAEEFKNSEPIPIEGHEGSYVDEDVLGVLEPAARTVMLDYVHDLARGEEHEAWMEVMRFTRERGQSLAREEGLSDDVSYAGSHSYTETAARVMDILASDFQRRARTQQARQSRAFTLVPPMEN